MGELSSERPTFCLKSVSFWAAGGPISGVVLAGVTFQRLLRALEVPGIGPGLLHMCSIQLTSGVLPSKEH